MPQVPAEYFAALTDRLRAGDEKAAREVYEKWTLRLVGLARHQLGHFLTGKEDPEDVVQSIYRSFFRRWQEGRYRAGDWHDVWALLAVIAIRKCAGRRQHYAAERRDPRREVPLASQDPAAGPAPEEAALLVETIGRLLEGLEPPERAIVELSLQGHSTQEISTRLGRAERTVQRVRQHVRSQLQRWNAEMVA
jgi:RNA polymerase sigma-70 factor (ECF subfamily)